MPPLKPSAFHAPGGLDCVVNFHYVLFFSPLVVTKSINVKCHTLPFKAEVTFVYCPHFETRVKLSKYLLICISTWYLSTKLQKDQSNAFSCNYIAYRHPHAKPLKLKLNLASLAHNTCYTLFHHKIKTKHAIN